MEKRLKGRKKVTHINSPKKNEFLLYCDLLANRLSTDVYTKEEKCCVENMILENKSPYFARAESIVPLQRYSNVWNWIPYLDKRTPLLAPVSGRKV